MAEPRQVVLYTNIIGLLGQGAVVADLIGYLHVVYADRWRQYVSRDGVLEATALASRRLEATWRVLGLGFGICGLDSKSVHY